MNRKGISVILSYALVFAIVITATALAYRWGEGEISELKDIKNLNSAENIFINIDSMIKEVNREGEGSSRKMRINFDKGEFIPSSYHVSITSFERDLKALSMLLEVKTNVLDANMTRDGNILKSYSNNIFRITESYLDICAETDENNVYTVINLIETDNVVISGNKEIYIKNEGVEELNYNVSPPYTLKIGNEEYTILTENNFLIVKREGAKIYTKFLGEGTKTYHLRIRIAHLTVRIF